MEAQYVLGNGFDLYHGLNTRYLDFHIFVRENDVDLEIKLEEYFRFELDEHFVWRNIEEDLCHFNNGNFFGNYNEIDVLDYSFKPNERYGLEDGITQEVAFLIEMLQNKFRNWIWGIRWEKWIGYIFN